VDVDQSAGRRRDAAAQGGLIVAGIIHEFTVRTGPPRVFHALATPQGMTHWRTQSWPSENQHWLLSCYCWAMYLRVMRRHLEYGDSVPYSQRLDA
jgi:hypothetical protein